MVLSFKVMDVKKMSMKTSMQVSQFRKILIKYKEIMQSKMNKEAYE